MSQVPACIYCGNRTYDPGKGQPWARGVRGGRQVLICPSCQKDRSGWADDLDRCEDCGATRLHLALGQVVCRACGHMKVSQKGA